MSCALFIPYLSGLHVFAPLVLYLATIAAFLLSVFWRPPIGLYFLSFFVPLQTVRYWLHAYWFGEKFVDFLLLGVILGLLLRGDSATWSRNPLTKPVVLWALFLYGSLWIGSFYLGSAWPITVSDPRFSDWKNYLVLPLLMFVTAAAIHSRKQMAILLVIMALSFAMVNRSYHSTMSDRDLSQFSYDVRDAGPLGGAGVNGLAAFEATGTVFLVGLLNGQFRRAYKWAIGALVATGLYSLLYTFSRGGYFGFLVGLAFLGILEQRKLLIVVAVLLISWQTLLPHSVQQRISMTYDTEAGALDASAQTRVDMWEDAEKLIRERPVLGTGFNTYAYLGRVGAFQDTHNYYVKMMVEAGVVGLLFFLYVLYRMFSLGFRLYRVADDPFLGTLGVSFCALMASMVAVNFFGDRWSYLQVDGFMWILLGLVVRALWLTEEERVLAKQPATLDPAPMGPFPQVSGGDPVPS
jgi:O-antigen ligase